MGPATPEIANQATIMMMANQSGFRPFTGVSVEFDTMK
jgi:hypothetical protein